MMDTKKYVVGVADDDLSKLVELENQGYQLVCPECGSKILVVDTQEKMFEAKSSRGAHCPQSFYHYGFILREPRQTDFLQEIEKELKQRSDSR
jgi:DNA-directed RNA polymerase subunit RPC12/RpoP